MCVLPLAHGIPLYASQLSFRSVPEAGTNTIPGPLFGYSPECIDPYLAGRGLDGNVRRDRGPKVDYKMHMGEKQIPPGVRRMSV